MIRNLLTDRRPYSTIPKREKIETARSAQRKGVQNHEKISVK